MRRPRRLARLLGIAGAVAALPLGAASAHAASPTIVQGTGDASGVRTTLQVTVENHDERITVSFDGTDYVITHGTGTSRIRRTDASGSPADGRTSPTLTGLQFDRNAKTGVDLVLDGSVQPLHFANRIDVDYDFESVELRGTISTLQPSGGSTQRVSINSPMVLGADTRLESRSIWLNGAVDGAHDLEADATVGLYIYFPIGAQTPLTSLNAEVDTSIVVYGDGTRIATTGAQSWTGTPSLRFAGTSATFAASRIDFDTYKIACSDQYNACSTTGRTLTLEVSEARVDGGTPGSVLTGAIGDDEETSLVPGPTNANAFKLVKAGAGTLTLSRRSYHLGATEVAGGTLRVTHAQALSTTTSGTSVTSGATLELAGVALAAEPLTLNGSGVGAAGALVGTGTSSAGGAITLATTSYVGAATGAALTLSGGLSGSHLVTSGPGRVQLTAAGTQASTSVGRGTLGVGHASALGSTSGAILVDAGAELEIASGVTVATGTGGLFLGSTDSSSPAILDLPAGGTFSRDITLGGVARIQNAAGTVSLTGAVAGAGRPLTIAGTVATSVLPGLASLDVTADGALSVDHGVQSTGTVTVDGVVAFTTSSLVTRTYGVTAARLGGSGAIRCGLTGGGGDCGAVVVDVSDPSGTTVFSGGFGGTSGLQANLSLTKRGAGALVLSGESRFTGVTIVAAGELRTTSTGSIGGGLSVGSVTVEAGARLSGAGSVGGGDWTGGVGQSVAGTVDLDGPAGPETMTTSRFDLVGGTLEVGVDGAGAHSQLQVANSVSLSASPVLRVRAGASIPDGTTAVIVRTTWVAPIGGTFAGLPEGATVTPTSGPGSFRITYAGGDGDDIALTWVAPPPAPPASDTGTGTGTGAGTGGSAAAPSSASAVRTTTPRRVGNALVSSVTVAGPGRITQTAALPRGRAAAQACRATRTVKRAGTYRLACPLSPKARAAAARGALRLTVVTTFTPKGGRPVTTRATVTVARGR